MTRTGKVLRVGLLVFLVALVAGIHFTIGWRPFIGARMRALTNRQFERTPGRVARGRYLTQGLLGCESCHSPKEWSKHGAPNVAGGELGGRGLAALGRPGRGSAAHPPGADCNGGAALAPRPYWRTRP